MERSKQTITTSQLKAWWFPIVVGLMVVVGSVSVLIPQLTQLVELRTDLDAQQKKLVTLQAKANQITQLDEALIERLADTVFLALPAHKPYYEVFTLLQQLSSETGVILGDFDLNPGSLATAAAATAPTASSKGYVSLETSIVIRGTAEQLAQFIDQLQRSLPLLTMTSVSVSGDTSNTLIRQAKLDITVHYVTSSANKDRGIEAKLAPLTDSDKQLLSSLLEYIPPVEQASSAATFSNFNRQDIFTY